MPGEEGFALPPFEEANQPRTPLTLEEAGISEQTDDR
jgi:hypothetical protein